MNEVIQGDKYTHMNSKPVFENVLSDRVSRPIASSFILNIFFCPRTHCPFCHLDISLNQYHYLSDFLIPAQMAARFEVKQLPNKDDSNIETEQKTLSGN